MLPWALDYYVPALLPVEAMKDGIINFSSFILPPLPNAQCPMPNSQFPIPILLAISPRWHYGLRTKINGQT